MINRLYVLRRMYLQKYGWGDMENISQDNRNKL